MTASNNTVCHISLDFLGSYRPDLSYLSSATRIMIHMKKQALLGQHFEMSSAANFWL